MKEFNSHWWSLHIPDNWCAEKNEICTTFISTSKIGVLQVSAARNDYGPATDDNLKDFAKEHIDAGAKIKTIKCGAFTGYYLHYSDNDFYRREWWLRCKDTVVFLTYTCSQKLKGQEDAVVNSILYTLKRK